MQGYILEFGCPRQTSQKGTTYFTHAIPKFYSLKAIQFYILSGSLLLRESTFYI